MKNNKHGNICRDNSCGLCCTKIENFNVSYGKKTILQDVNLHIHCGELTALIGPNGAGKSTLLKAILGEVKHSGQLKFCDAEGGRNSGKPVIGYVPQHLDFDSSTPASVLDLFIASRFFMPAWLSRSPKNKEKVRHSLEAVKAAHLIDRRLGALSGGELQRVLLALALDPVPDLLLLDEPVSGIDPEGLEVFYHLVSDLRENYDLSIILVSHDMALVRRYSDRVVLLNKTVLKCGSPVEVLGEENSGCFGDISS